MVLLPTVNGCHRGAAVRLHDDPELDPSCHRAETPPSRDLLDLMDMDLSSNQVRALEWVLRDYDMNEDGTLDRKEVILLLTELGYPHDPKSVDRIMKCLDRDGDGVISAAEVANARTNLADQDKALAHLLEDHKKRDHYESNSEGMLPYINKAREDFTQAKRQKRLQEEYAPNSWQAIDALLADEGHLLVICKQMFHDADSNSNGVLDRKELGAMLKRTAKELGLDMPNKEERRETFDDLDTDHSGRLTEEEFMANVRSYLGFKRKKLHDEEVRQRVEAKKAALEAECASIRQQVAAQVEIEDVEGLDELE
uniref:EF-hand domain-containing protein n=1 Tax=Eutreptiella gymnastica TaxID=73025 RepID=A0A7S1JFZ8_9EUGL|mmetsp:Transcript_92824/g.160810  ORF Transcript_92824/g.160810 Transcript_92824/m.160810 type:complete len:311 (+) Transcript_92824:144-1076(+)